MIAIFNPKHWYQLSKTHVGQLLLKTPQWGSKWLTEWVTPEWQWKGHWLGGGSRRQRRGQGGEGCRVTRRRGSVTLSVSQGDGCTLLGPAAPPALSEEPAAPDTDTSSHTDRPNMTRLRSRHRQGLTACRDTTRKEGWREIRINANWICVSWTGQTGRSSVRA